MIASSARCLMASGLVVLGMLACATAAQAQGPPKPLDLDTLSGAQAEQMMQRGQLTSVELTEECNAGDLENPPPTALKP